MDKLTRYTKMVKEILTYYADGPEMKFEEYERQHYYLMKVGWNDTQRIHACTLHVDIKGTTIWIQQDWTKEGIAGELLEQGVPKSDIVLGFQSPFRRQYMDFATG